MSLIKKIAARVRSMSNTRLASRGLLTSGLNDRVDYSIFQRLWFGHLGALRNGWFSYNPTTPTRVPYGLRSGFCVAFGVYPIVSHCFFDYITHLSSPWPFLLIRASSCTFGLNPMVSIVFARVCLLSFKLIVLFQWKKHN